MPLTATNTIPSGKTLMYFCVDSDHWGVFCVHFILHVPPCHGADASEVCYLFYSWMWFYHWVILCTKGSKESACSYDYKREAPFTLGFVVSMVGIIYVSMVLHSYVLSVLLCIAGSFTCITMLFHTFLVDLRA